MLSIGPKQQPKKKKKKKLDSKTFVDALLPPFWLIEDDLGFC